MIINITHEDDSSMKTAAYADDFTAVGKITQLKKWWDMLCQLGPNFGYYPEGGKSRHISTRKQYYAADIFLWNKYQNYNRRSTISRSSYWIR